jgi:hypothetical protein
VTQQVAFVALQFLFEFGEGGRAIAGGVGGAPRRPLLDVARQVKEVLFARAQRVLGNRV